MKLKHLLLSLLCAASLWAADSPSPDDLPDCAPVSMQYFAATMGFDRNIADWTKACKTDKDGTEMNNMMPAWYEMTRHETMLVPIYVIPEIPSMPALNKTFSQYRAAVDPEAVLQKGVFKYLWVGLHLDSTGKHWEPHCAVITFYEDRVHMVSPNSTDGKGKVLEEDFPMREFLIHTFVVFDVKILALPDPKLQALRTISF